MAWLYNCCHIGRYCLGGNRSTNNTLHRDRLITEKRDILARLPYVSLHFIQINQQRGYHAGSILLPHKVTHHPARRIDRFPEGMQGLQSRQIGVRLRSSRRCRRRTQDHLCLMLSHLEEEIQGRKGRSNGSPSRAFHTHVIIMDKVPLDRMTRPIYRYPESPVNRSGEYQIYRKATVFIPPPMVHWGGKAVFRCILLVITMFLWNCGQSKTGMFGLSKVSQLGVQI